MPIKGLHHCAYRCRDDKGRAAGLDTRGITDHGLFDSICLRGPSR